MSADGDGEAEEDLRGDAGEEQEAGEEGVAFCFGFLGEEIVVEAIVVFGGVDVADEDLVGC